VVADLPALVAACFLVALSPGPGTALVLRQAVRGGRRAALATVAGMELGVLCWAVAAALGLSVLVTASEVAYHALRVAGAVVLLWLGAKTLFGRGGDAPGETAAPAREFRAGLLVNVANPKLGVFAVSFLPQFVPAGGAGESLLLLVAVIWVAVIWVAVDTLWYLILVGLLHSVSGLLGGPRVRTGLEKLSGGVLLALGVRLVLDADRS
jgi:threonine/homoserine/homoserine lactone efflux protein